jgi:hypothetical protein
VWAESPAAARAAGAWCRTSLWAGELGFENLSELWVRDAAGSRMVECRYHLSAAEEEMMMVVVVVRRADGGDQRTVYVCLCYTPPNGIGRCGGLKSWCVRGQMN